MNDQPKLLRLDTVDFSKIEQFKVLGGPFWRLLP